jgi:hypothetical protein
MAGLKPTTSVKNFMNELVTTTVSRAVPAEIRLIRIFLFRL